MGRRRKNSGFDGLVGVAIFLAILWTGIKAVADAATLDEWIFIALGTSALILTLLLMRSRATRAKIRLNLEMIAARRASLLQKYGDAAVVEHIMSGDIWHDMTKEQLIDSWGHPVDIDTKVMKSKIREVYKYDRRGVNRFATRAVLENDVVVGWEQK